MYPYRGLRCINVSYYYYYCYDDDDDDDDDDDARVTRGHGSKQSCTFYKTRPSIISLLESRNLP